MGRVIVYIEGVWHPESLESRAPLRVIATGYEPGQRALIPLSYVYLTSRDRPPYGQQLRHMEDPYGDAPN